MIMRSKTSLFACGQSKIDDSSHPRVNVGQNHDANNGAKRYQYAVDHVVVGWWWRGRGAEWTEPVDGHEDQDDNKTTHNENCDDEVRNTADGLEPTVVSCCIISVNNKRALNRGHTSTYQLTEQLSSYHRHCEQQEGTQQRTYLHISAHRTAIISVNNKRAPNRGHTSTYQITDQQSSYHRHCEQQEGTQQRTYLYISAS